jgi:hypothetical protein
MVKLNGFFFDGSVTLSALNPKGSTLEDANYYKALLVIKTFKYLPS